MTAPALTQAIVRSLLHYDPETGVFTWLPRENSTRGWNKRYAGKRAGYAWKCGPHLTYWSIRIFDWPFLGHRLAWLYMTGDWPENGVDHENLNGLDNKWSNLRPATKVQNAANTPISRNNKTGFKGVSPRNAKFRAAIVVGGHQRHLGIFETAAEAGAAYAAAALAAFGKYARTS